MSAGGAVVPIVRRLSPRVVWDFVTERLMYYGVLADAAVVVHVLFVCFVVCGGLVVLWRPRLALLHLPAVVWGVAIECVNGVCPLTYLENHWRRLGGRGGYSGSFIQHCLEPLLYPLGLTSQDQILFGALALLINLAAYGWIWRQKFRR